MIKLGICSSSSLPGQKNGEPRQEEGSHPCDELVHRIITSVSLPFHYDCTELFGAALVFYLFLEV